MKKNISVLAISFAAFAGSLFHVPAAEANGWATAGKILAGVAGADLLFNGSNSMAGRTVAGVGNIFTGGGYYSRPQTCGYVYGYAQPAPVVYGYIQPAPRRCWEEVRRIPGYDSYGNFLGYFDKRVSVCTDY
jgi:hypothetical protein